MQILNQTRFVTAFTQGMDKAGQTYLSLVVKGTFAFPDAEGAEPALHPEQRPLVMADTYTGAPGFSAPLWETDFAFRKARCDVILNGAAYAPGGRAVTGVRVGVRVGPWSKVIDVLGAREWRTLGPAITATEPFPFTRMAFSYDTAFGGCDRSDPDDPAPAAYAPNPVGLGWAQARNQSRLAGRPLPNTQAPDYPVTSPYGAHRGTSYETGKNPQFNASVRTALLGALPEISLPITAASFVGTQLNILPLLLLAKVSDGGTDFSAAAAMSLILMAICVLVLGIGDVITNRRERKTH